jgi:hypothetical protein
MRRRPARLLQWIHTRGPRAAVAAVSVLTAVTAGHTANAQPAQAPAPATTDTSPTWDRFAIGLTGSVIWQNQFALGPTVSYAPYSFVAFGGEVLRFVNAGLAEVSEYCRPGVGVETTCGDIEGGTMLMPFVELRTPPWKVPINAFARISMGIALAELVDRSIDPVLAARAAAGFELRWYVYVRPYVFVGNRLGANHRQPLGYGGEVGVSF